MIAQSERAIKAGAIKIIKMSNYAAQLMFRTPAPIGVESIRDCIAAFRHKRFLELISI